MSEMFSLIKILKIFFVISFVLLTNSYICFCQEINEKYSKFLLTESEMTGYKLEKVTNITWPCSKDVVKQRWVSEGADDSKEFRICTCVFDSEHEAIKGMVLLSKSYAVDFRWGLFSGNIIGERSWSGAGTSLIFVRGNVGIKINNSVTSPVDQEYIEYIAQKILNKIEQNLSTEIHSIEQESKENQITSSKYHKITDEVIKSDVMSGFSSYSTWDSKWLLEDDSIAMGIRKEWKNEQGTIIGIDICEFKSDDLAKNAGDILKGETRSFKKFDMDDLSTLKAITEKYSFTPGLYDFSCISTKNKLAVHIYQFKKEGIDTDLFYSVASKLANRICFLATSVAIEEGKAAGQPQAFTLFQNLPNPFNQATAISYELRRAGRVSLRIYDLVGHEVALLEEGYRKPGRYQVFWDGKDSKGNPVSSGIYLYRLKVGSKEETKRMTLVR